MKRTIGLLIATLLFTSAKAVADDNETLLLNVSSGITKCSGNSQSQDCDTSDGDSTVASIELINCFTLGDFSECSGSWQSNVQRDGYIFDSHLTVVKTTMTQAQVSSKSSPKVAVQVTYRISADIEPRLSSQSPNSTSITLGQAGVLTDTVQISGESVTVANGNAPLNYQPILTIGPVNALSQRLKK